MDTIAASMIGDHPFDAKHWWDRCAACGYSMAAHVTMVDRLKTDRASSLGALDYRCPECVKLDHDKVDSNGVSFRVHTDCPHRWGGDVRDHA